MNQHHWAIFAGICLAPSVCYAVAATNDPADATSMVPPTIYQSPFADYRILGEDKNTPWKDANDTVRAIGGWRAYAKESAEAAKKEGSGLKPAQVAPAAMPDSTSPVPAAAPAPVPSPAPAPPQHKHGG